MPFTPGSAVSAFTRRVAAASFLTGALQATGVVATVAAATLLGSRLGGYGVVPDAWWALLLLPVVAGGWWRLRRERLAPAFAAAHLDRRLQLGGLLLAAHEGVALEPAWQRQLAAGLAAVPAALPRPRWAQLVRWPLAAVGLSTLLLLLPQPAPAPGALPPSFAATEAVERLQDELEELLQQPDLPPEVAKELEQQLERLQQQLGENSPALWRELDALQQRLGRESLLATAAASAAKAALGGQDPAALAQAAAALLGAGGLDALPAAAKALLQRAMDAAGGIDPSKLPIDAESLQKLAEAMAGAVEQLAAAAAGEAAAAGQLGKLSQQQLQDLRDLVAGACKGGGNQPGSAGGAGAAAGNANVAGGTETADGGDPAAPGRGGVSRGPGYAALNLTQDTQGDAEQSLVLPPGAAVPDQWVPVGSQIAVPEVQPVANPGAGGAGQAGRGGASWQLQLAPRHRQVVQRFFPSGAGAGNEDKR
jgi:hypothetical protein